MAGSVGVFQIQSIRHYFAVAIRTSALERTDYPMQYRQRTDGFIGINALLLRHKTDKKPVIAVIEAPTVIFVPSGAVKCAFKGVSKGFFALAWRQSSWMPYCFTCAMVIPP